jgi:hypothetical protein
VTAGAADVAEQMLAARNCGSDGRVVGDHLSGDIERDLKQCDRRHIGNGELVGEAVSVLVGSRPEALFRLDSVVVIEGVIRELAHRHDVSNLMERPDDQARWNSLRRCQAGAGMPCSLEMFQVSSLLWIKVPKEIPFELIATLDPAGVLSRWAWRSAVI